MFAGHLPVDTGDATIRDGRKLFYWMIRAGGEDGSKHPDDAKESVDGPGEKLPPLLIWLNGGPACSSMDGFFLENGPISLEDTGGDYSFRVTENPHSWHRAGVNTVYIDQPVGTGLSFLSSVSQYGHYPKNDLEVNMDFYGFLLNFFDLHSDLKGREVWFSGESHAGHYIPSMMDFIMGKNSELPGGGDDPDYIHLAGAAIGNGWTSPRHQYSASTKAWANGMISLDQKNAIDNKEKTCQNLLDSGSYDNSVCFNLLDDIIHASAASGGGQASIYDDRIFGKDSKDPFPPGHLSVEKYLRPGADALSFIHATQADTAGQVFKECTDPPWYALKHQDGLGVLGNVESVLNHATKPRMLFFNGMNDMICHHYGNERFLNAMDNWEGIEHFRSSTRFNWGKRPGKGGSRDGSGGPVGYLREYDNLQYLTLRESGHMVPMDLPEDSLEMIRELIWDGGVGKLKKRQSLQSSQGGVCDLDSGRARRTSAENIFEQLKVIEAQGQGQGQDNRNNVRKLSSQLDFKDGRSPSKPCKTYVDGEGNPPVGGGIFVIGGENGGGMLYLGGAFVMLFACVCWKMRQKNTGGGTEYAAVEEEIEMNGGNYLDDDDDDDIFTIIRRNKEEKEREEAGETERKEPVVKELPPGEGIKRFGGAKKI